MIESHTLAQTFSSLSHPARVDVLLKLMPYAASGLSAGELAQSTKLAPSTLAHHLREMEQGGVIVRQAEGRKTIVRPNLTSLTEIAALLTQLCCSAEAFTTSNTGSKPC